MARRGSLNQFIVYNIQIQSPDGTLGTRFVQKRFSEFRKLYKNLSKRIAPLPQSSNDCDNAFQQSRLKTFNNRFDLELLENRKQQLQHFLNMLDQEKNQHTIRYLSHFFMSGCHFTGF